MSDTRVYKDFVGLPLNTGDFVAAIRPGYRQIVLGQISGFTPKMVRVKFSQKTIYKYSQLYSPSNLVKLEGPHLTIKLLTKDQ